MEFLKLEYTNAVNLQCSDTVAGWQEDIRPVTSWGWWFVGDDDVTGALYVL